MRGRGVLAIRLSVTEKLRLAKAAVLRGLGLSTYVRQAALEQAERDLAPKPAPVAKSSLSPEDSVANSGSLFRQKGHEGCAIAISAEKVPPSRSYLHDDDEDEQSEAAEWMKERVARGQPDGATSLNEWKRLRG